MKSHEEIFENVIIMINEFCDFIENSANEEMNSNLYDFLDESQKHISKLYYEICTLPNLETDYLSTYREIPKKIKNTRLTQFYSISEKLRILLGNYDLYWHVFDPYNLQKDDPSQSRLSNDIAEIYDDFKGSIDEFEYFQLPIDQKIYNLKLSFSNHWSDHAYKALGSIKELLYSKIDWDE